MSEPSSINAPRLCSHTEKCIFLNFLNLDETFLRGRDELARMQLAGEKNSWNITSCWMKCLARPIGSRAWKRKKKERKKQPFLFNCCRRCHIIAAPLGHVLQMNMEYTTGWPNPYGANPFPEITQLWLNLKSTCIYTPKGSLESSSHLLSNTDYAAQHINTSD